MDGVKSVAASTDFFQVFVRRVNRRTIRRCTCNPRKKNYKRGFRLASRRTGAGRWALEKIPRSPSQIRKKIRSVSVSKYNRLKFVLILCILPNEL